MSDGFTTLTPKTLTIKNLLGDKNQRYLIPDYQREYRWKDDEQCQTLWNDLTEQFEGNTEGHYYLGSIIAHLEGKRLRIIDGQQRIITLSIFLRQLFGKIYGEKLKERQQAVYFRASQETVDAGGNSLWTLIEPPEHRVVSDVLGEVENNRLRYALDLTGKSIKPEKYGYCRYAKNSKFFADKIAEFSKEYEDNEGMDAARNKLVAFADYVLNHIYLLLIETKDLEGALTIFNTVNNRGMQLSDGDIIKARLFQQAGSESNEFNERWNNISAELRNGNEPDDDDDENDSEQSEVEKLLYSAKEKNFSAITELFRVYMHVLRARKRHVHDIVGLREFFIEGKNIGKSKETADTKDGNWHKIGNEQFPWKTVVGELERLSKVCQLAVSGKYPKLTNWLTAINALGKRECLMPLLVWFFPNVEIENDEAVLSTKKLREGIRFFREVARLSFSQALAANRTAKKFFEVSATVFSEKPYTFTPDNSTIDIINVKIQDKTSIQSGLVYLLELLQHENEPPKILPFGQVEHILPQKTNKGNSAGWSDDQIKEAKFKLGNLVILQQGNNGSAGNKAFEDKKDIYKNSIYKTAQELTNLSQWTYADWQQRHKTNVNVVLGFIEGTK
jgi:hypothetical protein